MIEIILAALFFGLSLIVIKISTSYLYPTLIAIIMGGIALIVQLIAIINAKINGISILITTKGILLSGIGGLFLGLYTIFLYFAFAKLA